ncbi:response regulator transcription factor [Zoogloea sp. LCSB751]|uniref:response regulator n=1 Tax=Zoogloea sp. LCSB751 TaxID=1965277 RepID=UPI0009A5399D|nr:response regulator transcription factor [Zoogloea sp. LCSB751]
MIRLMLADDHSIVRTGLKQVLSDAPEFTVCAEAATGDEVITQVRQAPPDLLLLDMSMPGRSGIELIKQLKSEYPRLPILVLSMHKEEQYAVRAIKAGAAGYLTKEHAGEELIGALRKVAGGGVFISPAVAERLALEYSARHNELPHTTLSDREYQIFQMIVAGATITAISERLSLSVKTVSTHKSRILQKMGMSSSAELIHYAIEHQLVELR